MESPSSIIRCKRKELRLSPEQSRYQTGRLCPTWGQRADESIRFQGCRAWMAQFEEGLPFFNDESNAAWIVAFETDPSQYRFTLPSRPIRTSAGIPWTLYASRAAKSESV